jgi:hypothetical protein
MAGVGVRVAYWLEVPDELGVDIAEAELVIVGVDKGLLLIVFVAVPDVVAKGLMVPVPDPVVDAVIDGVFAGVIQAVGDPVTVLDPDPDPVRVLEGLGAGEGVPV